MSRLNLVLALFCGCFAATSAAIPPRWMHEAQEQRASMYNHNDFDGLQGMYDSDSVVIPYHCDDFIRQDIGVFFEALHSARWTGMKFRPVVAFQENENLWHELGNMTLLTGTLVGAQYYIRWTRVQGQNWSIAFEAMSIGYYPEVAKELKNVADKQMPPQWLNDKDQKLSGFLFNNNFTAAAAMYNPGALIVPPNAKSFVTQPHLPALFKEIAGNGAWGVEMQPDFVQLEHPGTILHEIGSVSWGLNHRATYYTRWIQVGKDWQIALQLMMIGF